MSQLPVQNNGPILNVQPVDIQSNTSNSSIERDESQPGDSIMLELNYEPESILRSPEATPSPSPRILSSSSSTLSPSSSTPFKIQKTSHSVRKLRAWVWNHFSKLYSNDSINTGAIKPTSKDVFIAICGERDSLGRPCTFTKNSEKMLGGSTSALINHLESSHMYNRDGRKAVPKASLLEFFSPLNPEKEPCGVNEVLVEMVVKLNLPFTVSETKIFKEFVKVCRGDPADLILSGTIASRIRAKHETILSDIKIKLDESCESIALTLGIWTSPNGYGIRAINGTWLDENFKFNRELLHFNKIDGTIVAIISHPLYIQCLRTSTCVKS